MNTMVRKARQINKGVNGYDYLTFNVTPVWKDREFAGFDVSFYASDKEFENFKDFKPMHTTIDELTDLLVELRGLHIDNYQVNVYAYYHGCEELAQIYNYMIEELECYDKFHMEYEWG